MVRVMAAIPYRKKCYSRFQSEKWSLRNHQVQLQSSIILIRMPFCCTKNTLSYPAAPLEVRILDDAFWMAAYSRVLDVKKDTSYEKFMAKLPALGYRFAHALLCFENNFKTCPFPVDWVHLNL